MTKRTTKNNGRSGIKPKKKAPMPVNTAKKKTTAKATKPGETKENNYRKTDLRKGAALRTRDEFLQDGVPKPEYVDKPKVYYRVVYTVEVNERNEIAVVKRTTKKGRRLKSDPNTKFHEEIYIADDKGTPIKVGEKFARSKEEDITAEDVKYILKRCGFYPDTAGKLKKFRERKKPSK